MMTNQSDPNAKKPFVIPPPTLEELGIISLEDKSWVFKAWRIVCLVIFVSGVSASVGFYFWLDDLGVFTIDESFLSVLSNDQPADNSIVFDNQGNKVGEFFEEYHQYIAYEDLPKILVKAILAIEDRSFFSHSGIDFKAILRATKTSIQGRSYRQGASTLTQQLIRFYLLSKEKTLSRKVQEAFLAVRLEQVASKKKIFELYTNKLFLGNGAYGVGAASQRYFGKHLNELQTHELALIAGLFQSPSRYNPIRYPARAKARQRQVLRAMFQAKVISAKQAIDMATKPLEYKTYMPINDVFAPYFIDYVRDRAKTIIKGKVEGGGLRIYTTLDSQLQNFANQTFADMSDHFTFADGLLEKDDKKFHVNEFTAAPKVEAAMLSINPKSGAIVSMVGGRDYKSSQFNRAIQSLRSPGSAFKPVIYSLALERGWKWSDLMFVSPVSVNGYRPKNYKDKFLTETTLLKAFYQSLNTATVELGAKIGIEDVILQAQKLGIKTPMKNEPGTVLGSSEVTMLELANAYATIANQGNYTEPYVIERIEDRNGQLIYETPELKARSVQVMSPQIAYLMTKGMRAVVNHGTAQGTKNIADNIAGKTGTSNDSQDNWFVGYSPQLLTAVWLGNDEHLSIGGNAVGGTLAVPVWRDYMQKALPVLPRGAFPRPSGIVSMYVNPMFGNLASGGVKMYFIRGNEPTRGYSEFESIEHAAGEYRSILGH